MGLSHQTSAATGEIDRDTQHHQAEVCESFEPAASDRSVRSDVDQPEGVLANWKIELCAQTSSSSKFIPFNALIASV